MVTTLQGEFAENEYHGIGTYSWADGSSYTGSFSHNRCANVNSICMTIITALFFIPEWKERVNSLILQAEFGLVHLMERRLKV